jgi:hypothetical protein
MKFDINNPAKLEGIQKKYKFHRIQIHSAIALTIIFLFLGVFKNEFIILATIPILYLFFYFSLGSVYMGRGYRIDPITKYKEIDTEHCQKVLDFSEEYDEIRKYITLSNKDCRQLYYFEYLGFVNFINEKKSKIKEDNKKAVCHELYNEFK